MRVSCTLMRLLGAILCLAVVAQAEPGRCLFAPRECEDMYDSLDASRLPDSLRMTLQEKLDSDTGFVFWGNLKNFDRLAVEVNEGGFVHAIFHDDITPEQKDTFLSWCKKLHDEAHRRLDSIPSDLKNTFIDASGYTTHRYIRAEYSVQKVYNRQTKSWDAPSEKQKSITRYFLIHEGPVVETNPPRLLADFRLEEVHPSLERIFFESGRSRVITPAEFKDLDTFSGKQGTYLPYHYMIEVSKDMTPIYKEKIMNALGEGDRDAVRKNMTALDTFLVYANGRFFYSRPMPLTCSTKQLMNAYLRTFEDGLDCSGNPFMNESEKVLFSLLKDSVKTMYTSGELEKELAQCSSGDRAFWRVLGATLTTTDQDERNKFVEMNIDSIKKIEQRNFVINSFYKGWGIGLTAEMGMGGGLTFGLGDAYTTIPDAGTFIITLEFFYDKFGGGYNGRFFSSDKFDGDKFQSIYLFDLYGGFRTFATSHVENRIFLGPTLLFSDLMEKDNQKPLESFVGVGFHFGTAFDFYLSPYKSDGQARLGLRLIVGISNYYTDVVENSNGGTLSITLSPLLQFYDKRDKKYGE